jgi:hypothetical protein
MKKHVERFGYKTLSAKEFKNCHNGRVLLECPKGHEYCVTYHGFKDNGNRCLRCFLGNDFVSRPERKMRDFIERDLRNVNVIYNDRSIIAPKELDVYFHDLKVAVEVCGLYWHGEASSGKNKFYHYDKMKECADKGVRLITVFEDEACDKFDIVVSIIKRALGLSDNEALAGNCFIKTLDSKTANDFFNENHVRGGSDFVVVWGLFSDDELVAALGLSNPVKKRSNLNNELELKRFCEKKNFTVVGGARKLFEVAKEHCKNHGIGCVKSYCDMRYDNFFSTDCDLLGFKPVGFTKCAPHYFKNGKRIKNFFLNENKEERELNEIEFESLVGQGYDRVWDAGHRTYLYNFI